MADNKFSIIIIPSSSGRTLQLSVSKFTLYILAIAVFAFLAISAFFTYGFYAKTYQSKEISRLNSENEFLTAKITYFGQEIESLKSEYAEVVEKEQEIRTIFDLPVIDPQERMLGIGGPVFYPEEVPSYSHQVSYDTENRLDELIRLSTFEKEQYDTIYNSLVQMKVNLDHIPSIMPASGYITHGFGVRPDPFSKVRRMHHGMDICNREGTPIWASADGTVERIVNYPQLGKTLIVDHGNNIKSYYGHILKATVRPGQKVSRGDKIAEMGNTGRSTAPHLHYGIKINGKWVDPEEYIFNKNWLAKNN